MGGLACGGIPVGISSFFHVLGSKGERGMGVKPRGLYSLFRFSGELCGVLAIYYWDVGMPLLAC